MRRLSSCQKMYFRYVPQPEGHGGAIYPVSRELGVSAGQPTARETSVLYPTCSAPASPHYAQLFLRSSSDRVLTLYSNLPKRWIDLNRGQ
jgi:hypothetical protein